jgi:membrane-associated protease RseP (regulator of RpoE activity)
MAIEAYTVLERPPGAVSIRGRLLLDASAAHEVVSGRLAPNGYTAFLGRSDGREVLTFTPQVQVEHRTRPRLALALLVLTVLSTVFVGAMFATGDWAGLLRAPLSGVPFAAALMSILGVHEMSHYLTARHYGVHVSLPYFIPMPLSPFGTMGAFIAMRSLPRNRRQVLHIGMAGPLAGLVVSLVVVAYGLSISPVTRMAPGVAVLREGNSLLYMLLKRLILGQWLPRAGLDVNLSAVAFAGWAGLLVTGLNLIPAAQLDGGHVAYALLGRRARTLTLAIGLALGLLGFVWQGWWLWAVLILMLGARREVVLDEITPLRPLERALAIAVIVLFVLLFVPVPMQIG